MHLPGKIYCQETLISTTNIHIHKEVVLSTKYGPLNDKKFSIINF